MPLHNEVNLPRKKMKILSFFALLSCFFLSNATSLISVPSGELYIYRLSRQGWNVWEKKSFVDKRPGLKPYQNLKRDVQVVLYRLQRGKEVIFCKVEYDSQRDKIIENCTPSTEDTLKIDKN